MDDASSSIVDFSIRGSPAITTTRVITYTYDPLNRLTGAYYSTGERFEYAYDAVGNRTVMTDTAGVHTYTYDAANRLPSVDGVAYTWDARGDLTSDGVFTYAYNAAGRLVRAQSLTATLVYTYNADGLRVAQSVTGDVTTYTWDWASGVPKMFQSCNPQSLYLVGHDTLGRWDGAWAYHLPDALGSVRQVADGAGAVVSAREWTPYGVEVGAAQAGLGYAREWWDADVGLPYLRARWYAPGVGRFTQLDPYLGNVRLPSSLHRYVYVRNNPVLLTDPSGLIPPPPFPDPQQPGPTVGQMIDFFDWLYRKDGLLDCNCLEDSQSPLDSAWDLFIDFVCEYGPEHRYFDADDLLTYDVAMSTLVHNKLRQPLYQQGLEHLEDEQMQFNPGEFLLATSDLFLLIPSRWLFWLSSGDVPVNITHFMGSWDEYEVTRLGPRRARFVITNRTDRSSGSHFPGRFRPEYYEYLETLAAESPSLRSQAALPVIQSRPVISVLRPKYRSETIDPEGGGTMWQTFSWTGRLLGCGDEWKLPLPVVWLFIEIEPNWGNLRR